MLAKVVGYVINGLDGCAVDVEVDTNVGLPSFEIVGLPDAAVKESKERVRSAVKNSGKKFPNHKITVNLAPADVKKEGAGLDLPIAIGIICASGQLDARDKADAVIVGELSLDGGVRGVNGVLPILISAKAKGFKRAIVPSDNGTEARFISGIEIYAVRTLTEACEVLAGNPSEKPIEPADYAAFSEAEYESDLKYVKGQKFARRALEIAVSGNHNMIMVGPPGAGKSMLAKCVPSIMPIMSFKEALETTKIHSVAGLLSKEDGIVYKRPFITPHHTASNVALIGGGVSAKPGMISLAHNGVLYLDEMPEYNRAALESLRQPLEDRVITVSRIKASAKYPASFMLIGSMNPCPCGNYGSKTAECTCSMAQINKYRAKISGPLLDRIDIRIAVGNVEYSEIVSENLSEDSASVQKRVNRAREIQRERFKEDDINTNAEMSEKHMNKYCKMGKDCEGVLKNYFEVLNLSARARSRIIKVARTIADLEESENIETRHILEAMSYRGEI